jgi:cob(I)alamin adenosyltransferase
MKGLHDRPYFMSSPSSNPLDTVADTLTTESAQAGLSAEQYKRKMERRQAVQRQRLAERTVEKGLIIVHTGNGKGKTTAALGMVLRSLGHGYNVAIIQFIKGAWEPAEKAVFSLWPNQLDFHALGEGFTWETQDRDRDIAKANAAWETALTYIRNPTYRTILLDEVNIALKHGFLQIEQVLAGLAEKAPDTHIILTGRGAPNALLDRADLVTEMKLVKHPFREQGVKAQPGIEF